MAEPICAYCGGKATTKDHVVPRGLYPPSKVGSRVERITVPACSRCNSGWADEPHFRTVLVGEANPIVRELREGKTRRSFLQSDGDRRRRHVAQLLMPVELAEGERHKIYPADDPRFMRILRKVIRGLCHHHGLLPVVSDDQVWADVKRYPIPSELLEEMTKAHVMPDIIEYRFSHVQADDIHSTWHLLFFERTPFYAIVFETAQPKEAALTSANLGAS
ncbi:hypothetical protein COMA2_200013 [Candidatus Nitrospira nitrificans]|uniref:HNH endonuclease 5 domain-containing protein n=1 Tax=Candidatus Nitrospira nitrificans TaxID=1742973 RepID=A0A0S4LJ32_9BACT|nr:hypothetical protein COMA2_200013 [Candidatus Nitrospira nitrificans]